MQIVRYLGFHLDHFDSIPRQSAWWNSGPFVLYVAEATINNHPLTQDDAELFVSQLYTNLRDKIARKMQNAEKPIDSPKSCTRTSRESRSHRSEEVESDQSVVILSDDEQPNINATSALEPSVESRESRSHRSENVESDSSVEIIDDRPGEQSEKEATPAEKPQPEYQDYPVQDSSTVDTGRSTRSKSRAPRKSVDEETHASSSDNVARRRSKSRTSRAARTTRSKSRTAAPEPRSQSPPAEDMEIETSPAVVDEGPSRRTRSRSKPTELPPREASTSPEAMEIDEDNSSFENGSGVQNLSVDELSDTMGNLSFEDYVSGEGGEETQQNDDEEEDEKIEEKKTKDKNEDEKEEEPINRKVNYDKPYEAPKIKASKKQNKDKEEDNVLPPAKKSKKKAAEVRDKNVPVSSKKSGKRPKPADLRKKPKKPRSLPEGNGKPGAPDDEPGDSDDENDGSDIEDEDDEPFEDEEAQKLFYKLPPLPKPEIIAPHPEREYNKCCVFCKQDVSPFPWEHEDIMPNKAMRCGHVHEDSQCKSVFHPSCISNFLTINFMVPQYMALPELVGFLFCPDHVCQTCFSDGYMRTARQGKLLKDAKKLRSFHVQCSPVGSKMNKDKMLELVDFRTPETQFKGAHSPACTICGEKVKSRKNQCRNCINSTHPKCGGKDGKCTCCQFDEQIEYHQPVLVYSRNYFRVGKCWLWKDAAKKKKSIKTSENFRKPGFVPVFLENEEKFVIRKIKAVQRVRPDCANAFFRTIKETYQTMGNSRERKAEENALRKLLKERQDNVKNRDPKIELTNESVFDPSLLDGRPYSFAIRELDEKNEVLPSHPDIEIKFCGAMGNGVFATEDIPKGTTICEYNGVYLSHPEHMRHKKIKKDVKDHQEPEYTYGTSILAKDKNGVWHKYKIACDSTKVHNISAIFNSHCNPNVVARRKNGVLNDAGTARIQKIVMVTRWDIKKGEQLFIDYHWEDFDCLCGYKKCRQAKKPLDWR